MEENVDWGCCSDGTDTEDQETINLKDWNDEEYNHNNPFKPSPGFTPKLQFRKDVSQARWDEDMGMSVVTEKKGGMWTTTGIIGGGKLYCLLEETLFFAERGALILLDANDTALSLTNIYEKVAKDKNGCSWESFEKVSSWQSQFHTLIFLVMTHHQKQKYKYSRQSDKMEVDMHEMLQSAPLGTTL
ncbi:tRNA-splicing endonuclease [Cinnamomum micranthum f. kanehirae]|uniref:tRNA-splicing endonuclease n=1 Tax=Cinnamomum micranthum f. kanehirae TaxID=337451 RepID=A0A443NBD6_9MAGN|nr:tRNA-splicing endonuclease [Cinnamomum micranthum f. kanehirae]